MAKADSIDVEAEAAILVDAETGKVLYGKNQDEMLGIASMTKMMTEYLVLEAIDEGEIDWDTTTQISDFPYSISADPAFSGIGLIQDKDYTVKELYEAMAIYSDNATTIALAELIAGSEGDFVQMMNQKAEELGLTNYKFVNSTGLSNEHLGENYPEGTQPDEENLMSAESTALLAYRLVNDFPEALDYSSMLTSELDDQLMINWNWMLPWDNANFKQYYSEGVDGLKTGYTELAGYCFTGTAERNGKRLISVIMNTDVDGIESKREKEGKRFKQTQKLLDYGYGKFETKELYPSGHQIEGESLLPVSKGKQDEVEIVSDQPISSIIKSGDEENYQVTYNIDESLLDEDGQLVAPIEKGQKVGTMELVYDGDQDYGYILEQENQAVDVVTTDAVEKKNWFMLFLSSIGNFFGNLFG